LERRESLAVLPWRFYFPQEWAKARRRRAVSASLAPVTKGFANGLVANYRPFSRPQVVHSEGVARQVLYVSVHQGGARAVKAWTPRRPAMALGSLIQWARRMVRLSADERSSSTRSTPLRVQLGREL